MNPVHDIDTGTNVLWYSNSETTVNQAARAAKKTNDCSKIQLQIPMDRNQPWAEQKTNPTNACPNTWRCKCKTIEGGIQYYTNVLRRGFADRQSRPERRATFQLNQLQENWYRRPTKTASELTGQRAAELLAQPKLALGCKSSASYKNVCLLYQHISMTRNVMNWTGGRCRRYHTLSMNARTQGHS